MPHSGAVAHRRDDVESVEMRAASTMLGQPSSQLFGFQPVKQGE